MRFEWDPWKAEVNYRKYGVEFTDAITAFDDPFGLMADDVAHSTDEEARQWLIGESDIGVLVVVFTLRHGGEVARLISARRASRRERLRYEAWGQARGSRSSREGCGEVPAGVDSLASEGAQLGS